MKYTVIAPITLGPGLVLGLTDAQAAARSGSLRAISKGKYEVTAAVQFKAGEVVHTDADLPKSLTEVVETSAKKRQQQEPVAAPQPADSQGTTTPMAAD